MAHPFSEHRQHHVERNRVHKLTGHHAHGGMVHFDAAEDRKMIKSMVKGKALKVHGKKSGGRLDRYARGGKVKSKKGGTHVNIMVGHPGAQAAPPMPIPAMPQGMMPPPRPPIAPPGPMAAGAAPGAPMGGTPMPPMPIRRSGGRAYAKGGKVTAAWKEGLKNGTKVMNSPGKNDTADIHRGKQITYKRGGKVEASSKVVHNIDDGAGSGPGRIEKIALQKT